MDKENVVCLCVYIKLEYYSLSKKEDPCIRDDMDEFKVHYVKFGRQKYVCLDLVV